MLYAPLSPRHAPCPLRSAPCALQIIKPLTLTLSLLFLFSCSLRAQEYNWASRVGGTSGDYSVEISTDKFGNTYIVGITESQACYFNTDTLITKGENDIVVAKYDPRGNEVWIRQLGWYNESSAGYYERVGGIICDTIHDRVLVSGTFYMHLNLTDTTLNSWGTDLFVVSIDANGNFLWGRTAPSLDEYWGSDSRPFGITYDEDGNVYVSGSNSDTLNFDGIKVPRGGFLAKYDIDGNIIWAKNKFRYWAKYNTPSYPYTEGPPYNLTYCNGHLYVNGNIYNDTISIDSITISFEPNSYRSYIASFSNDGSVEWLKPSGGPSGNCGREILCDKSGNIYITGNIGKTGIFEDDTLYSPTKQGNSFIAKYTADGSYLWAIDAHSSGFSDGGGLACDRNDQVYYSGYFAGKLYFGNTILESSTSSDMFLAKCSSDGEFLGGKNLGVGGTGSLSIGPDNLIAIVGVFEGTLNLEPYTLVSRGYTDIFVTKSAPITGVENTEEFASNRLLIYANPNTGECTITIPEEIRNEKELLLQVFDQNGKLIMQSTLDSSSGTAPIDIRSHARGIYQAVLTSGSKQYSGKIVFTDF